MKYFTILLLFVTYLFGISIELQAQSSPKPWVTQEWTDSDWLNVSRVNETKNMDNKVAQTVNEKWYGSDWIPDYRIVFEYDDNGNNTLIAIQNYEDSEWKDYNETEIEYNNNSQVISEVTYQWNGTEWEYSYKAEYTYNSKKLLEKETSYFGNVDIWEEFYRLTYSYDSKNREIEIVDEMYLFDDEWLNSGKETVTYDDNSREQTRTYHDWDDVNQEWVESSRRTNTYLKEKLISERLTENYDNSSWSYSKKILYTYNDDDKYDEIIEMLWDGSAWQKKEGTFHYYNDNGLYWLENKNWEDNDWQNSKRHFIEGSILGVMDNDISSLVNARVFSNFSANPFVILESNIAGRANIALIDISGRMVKRYSTELSAGRNEFNPDLKTIVPGFI